MQAVEVTHKKRGSPTIPVEELLRKLEVEAYCQIAGENDEDPNPKSKSTDTVF